MIINFSREKLEKDILLQLGKEEILFPLMVSHKGKLKEQVEDLIKSFFDIVGKSSIEIDSIVLPSLNIVAVLTMFELLKRRINPEIIVTIPDHRLGKDILQEIVCINKKMIT